MTSNTLFYKWGKPSTSPAQREYVTSSNIQVNLRLFTSGDHFKNNRSFTMLSCHHKRENRLWAVTWEKTCCSNHVFVYFFLSSLLAFILSSSICSHTSHIQIILNKHMPLKATFFKMLCYLFLSLWCLLGTYFITIWNYLIFYVLRCLFLFSPSCHIIPLQRLYWYDSLRGSIVAITIHNMNTKNTHGLCVGMYITFSVT